MPDVTAPVVGNYSPTPGTQITSTTAIGFDVTDDSGAFGLIMITVSYPNGQWEVVHTGTVFAPLFVAGSTRTAIANGFRYTVRRTGGWPAAPTVVSYAIDASGNQV